MGFGRQIIPRSSTDWEKVIIPFKVDRGEVKTTMSKHISANPKYIIDFFVNPIIICLE